MVVYRIRVRVVEHGYRATVWRGLRKLASAAYGDPNEALAWAKVFCDRRADGGRVTLKYTPDVRGDT